MTRPGDEPPAGEPRRVPVHRNPFVWAFLVGIITLTALRPLLRHIPDPPPSFGSVPTFTLIDQDGRRFGSGDLLGRVTIANFFCTQCASSTAVMTGLRRIQDAYKERGIDGIGFVSITVDPEADTPERLRDYARTIGADAGRWTFLTGDAAVARRLAIDLVDRTPVIPAGASEDAARKRVSGETNGRPLLLIDQHGQVRGWYGADESGLDEIYNRAQHVLLQTE